MGIGAPKEKRLALVIGNSKYREGTKLRDPANDAIGISLALEGFDFEVVGGRKDGINLDFLSFSERVRDFARRLRQSNATVALFFYAGHGIQLDGRNYLVPIDTKLKYELGIYSELIDLDKIFFEMDRPNCTSLVMLDACRNNPFGQNLRRAIASDDTRAISGSSPGFAARPSVVTLIAFAAAPGKVAFDGERNVAGAGRWVCAWDYAWSGFYICGDGVC